MQTPDRRALRERLIASREAIDPVARVMHTAAITSHLASLLDGLAPASLGFCWPYRGEVDLRALVSDWLAADTTRRVGLPVVQGGQMHFRQWSPGDALQPDQFGIPAPVAGEVFDPAVLLVPLNGFNAHGCRLGYGGGYFDRALAAWLPRPLTIGVGFELARVDELQAAPHDIVMDWVVTEAGLVVQPPALP